MSDDDLEKINRQEIKEIEQAIINANPSIQKISAKQRQELIKATISIVAVSKSHSGPLPDVETLEGYNQIIPNGAERLMRQVEEQGKHRRKIENRVVNWNNLQSLIGQVFGLIIAGGFLYACFQLAIQGHDTVAGVLGGTTIVSLVGIFVYGKQKQKE